MKFRRLATAALAAVTALGMSLTAAADVVENIGNVSVTAYSLGDSTEIENLLFTELEDGTYEVGYNYNGAKPVGTVIIPETANGRLVTRIADAGFYNCAGLTDVVMPDSIISVGANAFTGTAFLNNQKGSIKYAGKVAVWCDGNAENISVAEGTLGLADKLFARAEKLKTAMLPEGLINLGYCTFDGCSKLVSVYIPSSVTVIQSGVFSGCTALSSIVIPQSVTGIGAYAFESSGITAVDLTNVTVIGKGAFENSKLAADSVIVSDGYMDIGGRAFAGTAFYDALGSEKYLGSVFLGCDKNVKSVSIREGTTAIAGMAFSSCSDLTDVVIPEGVTTIGDDAFFNCPSLSSATLPEGVTDIGKDAFRLCSGIKAVSLPLSLKSVDRGAFYGCDAVETATYAGSVTDWRNISAGDEYSLPFASVEFGQEPSALEPVTGLKVTKVTENSVSLKWGPHSIATTYRIDVYHDGAWFNAGETDGATSFTVKGLDQRSDYIFHVSARVHGVFGSPAETKATTLLAATKNFKGKGYAESIVLTWDKNSAADSYQIDILRDNEWKSLVKTADNKTTSYKVTGLSPSTSYTFRISSFYGSEYREAPVITVATTPLPETPTGLTATATEDSITLSWDASPNADSYEVDIYKEAKWTAVAKGTATSVTAKGLSAGTSYMFRVYAFNGDTYSSPARTTATTKKSATPPTTPDAVTGFEASTTENSIALTWNSVSGADSYQIDVYQNGKWSYVTKTSATSYTITQGLSANTSYQFRIFAFNGDLYSSSVKLTATTKATSTPTPTTPSAVTGFKASTTENSITLSWNKVSGADSYQIDVYQNGKWSYVAKTSATRYTVTQGLSANTSYQFRIFAFNGDLYSSSVKLTATTKAATTPTNPSAVTGFKASTTENSITLSWNKVSGADSYQIDVYQNGKWSYVAKTSATSYTVTQGLSAGTSYQFRIFAFNGNLYSSSVKLTATTKAATTPTPTKPSAVTGFKASTTKNSVALSWDKVSGADSYQIDIFRNGSWKYLTKTAGNSFTATGLSANTSYQFRIFAFNGDLYSSSVKLTALTLPSSSSTGKPNAVTGFKASTTSNTVTLSWNAVSGADSYQIDAYLNGKWSYVAKTSATSYTITQGLSANTSYQFRIFAFNGDLYSSSVKLTALTSPSSSSTGKPNAVTGFKASATSDSVALSWNAVSGADSYQIDIFKNGAWTYLTKTSGTSYTHKGLLANTNYQYRIFAFSKSAYSASVKLTATTMAAISSTKPSAVSNFSATSTADTITLTWRKVSGADSYQIDVYQNGKWSYVAKTASTSYTVTQGLTPGKTYQFRIFAFNGEAYSPSVSVKVTTKTVLAPMPYGQSGGGVSEAFTKLKGIDVSGWQGVIDFNTVKESGVDFVIVKAGEKYETMKTWETNYANAKRAGLLVGAYWFSHATTPAAAKKEAQAFIGAMKGKSFDFPVYLDIEKTDQFDIGIDACTQVIETFCTTLEKAGYYAGVYCSTYWYTNFVHENVRLKRPAWIADYRGNCYYNAAYGIWQYGYGKVDGVEADSCDLNWGYIDYSKNILAHKRNGF